MLQLIKNPVILKWGVIILAFITLFTYGKIQYVRLEQAHADLAVANQSIKALENSLDAERAKVIQREKDAEEKAEIIDQISTQHENLSVEYSQLEKQLDSILDNIDDDIKEQGKVEIQKFVQDTLESSYSCIEFATGNKDSTCKELKP